MAIRLNIGAGTVPVDGFTPIDRRLGTEAYPLPYADNSVDEIRASHILEHFPFGCVTSVLTDWVRALKPGGRIRIAVPNLEWIVSADGRSDPRSHLYLMGGQTDDDDFHRSVFTRTSLAQLMSEAGLGSISEWTSDVRDCASLPCSLNLEGVKQAATSLSTQPGVSATQEIKICAVMSIPRVGWNDTWGCVFEALRPFRIPVHRFNGVFWGQCMQRSFEDLIAKGVDWILTIDYDSCFNARQLDMLMHTLGQRPDIDAICALQPKRNNGGALAFIDGATSVDIDGHPFRVDSGHFGLTIIRAEYLNALPKPWFLAVPSPDGTWGEGRQDEDIYFWSRWKAAGRSLYVHPGARIGHLELQVSMYDDVFQPVQIPVSEWRDRYREKGCDDTAQMPLAAI